MSTFWEDSETWSFNPQMGCVLKNRFKGKLFDSYFGKNSHHTQNHALQLLLRVYLKPLNTKIATDLKKQNLPAKNWTSDEWMNFTSMFKRQSHLWNNRFWLIPPKYFALLDDKSGGRAKRPNIACRLITEVTNSPSNAHRTIDVVNLDVEAIKEQMEINPTSGTFRSSAHHLDSLDVKKRNPVYEDDRGVEHTIKNYYTIAHEVGHAIGLPHIGVLKGTANCSLAISLRKQGRRNVAERFKGGSNAAVCYGRYDSLGTAENIMGLGTKYEEVNAKPWLERVAMHTNTRAGDWKVSLSLISPKAVA
jgi:hypothetical protein